MGHVNRNVTVSTGGLSDLNAALAWAVQTIEAEGLPTPNVDIRAYWDVTSGDDSGDPRYEVSVYGEQPSSSGRSDDDAR